MDLNKMSDWERGLAMTINALVKVVLGLVMI